MVTLTPSRARYFSLALLPGLMLLCALCAPVARAADGAAYFRIGTGSIAGTYFPVGEALASILSQPAGAPPCDPGGRCGVPGLIATAQATEGSVANVERVNSGELEAGLAQASIINAAYRGLKPYTKAGAFTNLRALANLYPESLHLVVARGSRIRDVAGLKGKRVSLDQALSGTAADTGLILAAYGLKRTDLKVVEDSPVRAADMLAQGKIDAFFFIGGFPAALIADLAEQAEIDLLPIAGPQTKKLIKDNPFFSLGQIPAGTYRGIGAVETVQVGAQLIVGAKLPNDLAYAITAKLWDPANRPALLKRHPKAESIRLETALTGVTIPVHPGAERFYREKGLIK
jgi:TRAP transporter TAXI family solute receptor